jgi:hypothetical protein
MVLFSVLNPHLSDGNYIINSDGYSPCQLTLQVFGLVSLNNHVNQLLIINLCMHLSIYISIFYCLSVCISPLLVLFLWRTLINMKMRMIDLGSLNK